tara:strand:- start:413 stop:652 length:240 start_codon:yes stop_codon:yes gene_type:complete
MAFMRGSNDVQPHEALLFSYWQIILHLLKIGISWESVMNFSEEEIHLIIGIDMAVQQREEDEQNREAANSRLASNMRAL